MIDEHSEQSYTEVGNVVESDYLDRQTGDFTETYRQELPLPDADSEAKQVQLLTEREMKRVHAWRTIMLISLFVTGALVSIGAFLFLYQVQQSNYINVYHAYASSLEDVANVNARSLQSVIRGLSDSITSGACEHNESFPFVTVDMFEVLGRNAREQSESLVILWSPIVMQSQRLDWENYSVVNQGWIQESMQLATLNAPSLRLADEKGETGSEICPFIFDTDYASDNLTRKPAPPADFYIPFWQVSPVPSNATIINSNRLNGALSIEETLWQAAAASREGVFSYARNSSVITFLHENFKTNNLVNDTAAEHGPMSFFVEPIFAKFHNRSSKVVGFVQALISWDWYVGHLLHEGINGVHFLVNNSCGQSFTYFLEGSDIRYLGEGDLHETQYDQTAIVIPFNSYSNSNVTPSIPGHCRYSFVIYSAQSFYAQSTSKSPVIAAVCIALIFIIIAISFLIYDYYVRRRNGIVADMATRSVKIVSTLFPSNVRKRMFADDKNLKPGDQATAAMGTTKNLKNYLDDVEEDNEDEEQLGYVGKPIADLFPATTVLFADIAGFTAWSSVREPVQVFNLLETLYGSFDEIAQRRRVYKVETVGDCYVAVAGLPDPRCDHAVLMARFARDCMFRVRFLTRKLESTLGPDTGDLAMRAGLHSGPVTAGVLRGERSRFQLFGDTMNTASRMESTGVKGRIQVSQETADLLTEAGKGTWCVPREERVFAKGKGELQTYWLFLDTYNDGVANHTTDQNPVSERDEDHTIIELLDEDRAFSISSDKMKRLIEWNVEVLLELLRKLVAFRKSTGKPVFCPSHNMSFESRFSICGSPVIEEVREIITLPQFDNVVEGDVDSFVNLPPKVVEQLYDYIFNIAALYNDNPFHNFEHASHVTMSVVKLLSRIVAPGDARMKGKKLHDHTYGITSDPLTQFACVFSALIHDVDHSGAPNAQLVKENTQLAQYYNSQSVAEQNSIDLSWRLLMDESYKDLRGVIYTDENEFIRFRQLVVNSVMATDIVDKDMKMLRNARWAKAFRQEESGQDNSFDAINRKATIVIEHLIQASDVAHTMQHWNIYRKWNERFFCECYKAFLEGRAEKNPAEGWYQGELGFFDFYIVPLARKLKDCGVFGVSSDEYLNYALKNRRDWENKGREVVSGMIERVNKGLENGSKTNRDMDKTSHQTLYKEH